MNLRPGAPLQVRAKRAAAAVRQPVQAWFSVIVSILLGYARGTSTTSPIESSPTFLTPSSGLTGGASMVVTAGADARCAQTER